MEKIRSEPTFHDLLESAPDAMIIIDSNGEIVHTNSQTERLFGYSKGELIGNKLEILLPYRYRGIHVGHRGHYFSAPAVRPMGAALDLFAMHKEGTEFPVEISLSPLKAIDGETYVISAIRDISERKQIEERVCNSLREKEVLLKEVHHRVKNNLQIISSILNLQSHTIVDEKTRELLDDTRARVRSIALVHERLYESKDLVSIDFGEYVEGLMTDLFQAFGAHSQNVAVNINIEPVTLDIDKIVNCGLIVNELVSNSLKYAFGQGSGGKIDISLQKDRGNLSLKIRDNGSGLPPGFKVSSSKTLGLTLVHGLTKELGGSVEMKSEQGAEFTIIFPV